MVPKIDKFDFYSYETIGGKIIQLIGESTDRFEPTFLDSEQILKISERAKLCTILSSIAFRIDSYGLINFFIDHNDELENFKLLKNLLVEFNDFRSINYIEKSLQFLEDNFELIDRLRSHPDDWELKHNSLERKINFENTLFKSIVLLEKEIRKKPSDFCFDENGEPIDPNFCGKLKRYYPNGNLKHEYNFRKGRVHGLGLDYSLGGWKERELLYNYGKKVKVLRKWDKEGKEK